MRREGMEGEREGGRMVAERGSLEFGFFVSDMTRELDAARGQPRELLVHFVVILLLFSTMQVVCPPPLTSVERNRAGGMH